VTQADDPWWRRPASGEPPYPRTAQYRASTPLSAAEEAAGNGYAGPPRSNPPPATWRQLYVGTPPPPRTLPAQDHARIDLEEQAARTLTQGIGMVIGAIALVLLFVLCARGFF
jgi:hypothetical protein